MSEGPTAPFRGLVGTWVRECPGYMILFYAYQKCFGFIKRYELLGNNLNAALSGGIAGRIFRICFRFCMRVPYTVRYQHF